MWNLFEKKSILYTNEINEKLIQKYKLKIIFQIINEFNFIYFTIIIP